MREQLFSGTTSAPPSLGGAFVQVRMDQKPGDAGDPSLPGTPRHHNLPRGQCRRAFLWRHKLPYLVSDIDLPRTRDLLLRIGDQLLPLREPA